MFKQLFLCFASFSQHNLLQNKLMHFEQDCMESNLLISKHFELEHL